jgi:hypothetical protein
MIPDENGAKVQRYQRSALEGVGIGNVLATNQLHRCWSAASGDAVTLARGGLSLVAAPRALGLIASLEFLE